MFRGRVRHVHFIGIGGIGMSGLAEILRTLDFDVSGSDLKPNENTRRLEGLGVRIQVGHAAANVEGADVVVYSSAIDPKNPEIVRARALEIPIIARAGGAVCIRQDDATPERLARELERLLGDDAARVRMADASRARGRPGAATDVASDMLDLAGIARRPRPSSTNGTTRGQRTAAQEAH